MKITVIGHQWWWEFRYEDKQIITANDVYIPWASRCSSR